MTGEAAGAADRPADARPTVEITGIGAGGAGVGRLPDGRAVFVPRTAPGELVEIRVVEEKRRWARGELVAIRRAAPERRTAPCRFYDRCGGCALEHLEYAAQLEAKAGLIADALQRIGGTVVERPAVAGSPREFRYRNRVSFTLVRLGGDRVVAGFHELGRPTRILDVTEACLLPEEALATAWAQLRGEWGRNAFRLPSGRQLRLTLRAAADGAATLLVDRGYGAGRPEELLARVPALTAIWRGRKGQAPELLAGAEELPERWGDEEVRLGGAVFLQVNRGAAALLEAHVLELAGEVADRAVVDAYCGVGLHARRLVRRGARVTGIELDAAAVAEARRGAPDARFIVGAVETHLADALPAGLVILNPPRTGLDPAVPELLLRLPPARLIYVSCDPATLARDLTRLAPVFRLASVRGFDLFPQTGHVETVAELTCATS
jgi:23S rRNA (uracil1939-C5)-methyltransferase